MDGSSKGAGLAAGKSAAPWPIPERELQRWSESRVVVLTRKPSSDQTGNRTKTDTGGMVLAYQGAREKPR